MRRGWALTGVMLALALGYTAGNAANATALQLAAKRVKPDAAIFSSCRGGTGAYYQMFTKEGGAASATRYTYISADIELAGGDARSVYITNPDKDVAFVFLGGNGTDGWWLDAGLQYSPLRRDWALFFWDEGKALEAAGKPFKRRSTPALSPDDRFAPNQTVSLEMFVPQRPVLGARRPLDNRVAVIARGRGRDNGPTRGKAQVRRYVFEVRGAGPATGSPTGAASTSAIR